MNLDQQLSMKVNDLQDLIENSDFENAHAKAKVENALMSLQSAKHIMNRPDRPDECAGFPTPNCERKPSKYHDLHNSWYCVDCWNEKVAHYIS